MLARKIRDLRRDGFNTGERLYTMEVSKEISGFHRQSGGKLLECNVNRPSDLKIVLLLSSRYTNQKCMYSWRLHAKFTFPAVTVVHVSFQRSSWHVVWFKNIVTRLPFSARSPRVLVPIRICHLSQRGSDESRAASPFSKGASASYPTKQSRTDQLTLHETCQHLTSIL